MQGEHSLPEFALIILCSTSHPSFMNEGITDPSDWPPQFAPLGEIDSHLRCPICKELLRAAMMLQCHHNFCSECIRRHLDKESTCPACRVATSTAQMRRNTALDEIANSFRDCRSLLLKTVLESLEPKHTPTPQLSRSESMDIEYESQSHKRRRTSSRMSTRSSSHSNNQDHIEAVMTTHSEGDDDNDDDFFMASQDSTSSYKGKNVARSAAGPALRSRTGRQRSPTVTTVDSPQRQGQLQYHPAPLSQSGPQSQSQSTSAVSTLAPSTPTTPTQPQAGTLVPCPVCEVAIPVSYSETHLDKYCLIGKKDSAYTIPFKLFLDQSREVIELYERQGTTKQTVVRPSSVGSPQRPSTSNLFDMSKSRSGSPLQNRTKQLTISGVIPNQTYPEQKRIPKLTYSVLNDKQLRKKLGELGLAIHGDRQLLQKRHAEYVTIYNANCDATRPQTNTQLMKAMEAWERAYEQDLVAKEEQRRVLEQQQRKQQEIAQREAKAKAKAKAEANVEAKSSAAGAPLTTTVLLSQGSTIDGGDAAGSARSFVPNQTNNTDVAIAVASSSAFAHSLKYANEYAELIADVKRRSQTDKDKTMADKQKEIAKDQLQETAQNHLT
ncbi:hypothetical protein BC939DRAFT_460224 [Gamsiella multidivaricata]|uniref:uncharacterized protein n=1 Tax=Gamsiella multidivaricata TaxID=101098 RepID=UPI002220905E|nr:uncharacterized protein BC939DRAFT_460224 [Gamsiella multidivaricata]KAI7819428.1 hypothetical protein BC939DRAFT_460224 [Gamsiella multidivaricata]